MTSLHNDEVLIADKTSTLKIIKSAGSPHDSIYNVGSLIITAVHVTADHKIVVGARSDEFYYEDGRHVVIMMNEEGEQERAWEYIKDVQIFNNPRDITSTKRGNIFVVDWLSNKTGRIIVLERKGEVLETFCGHTSIHKDGKLFNPRGIARTQSDNILVNDRATNTLILLHNLGTPLTYFNAKDVGICNMSSLSFSVQGTLFIGCSFTEDEDIEQKYNLYEVDYSEMY